MTESKTYVIHDVNNFPFTTNFILLSDLIKHLENNVSISYKDYMQQYNFTMTQFHDHNQRILGDNEQILKYLKQVEYFYTYAKMVNFMSDQRLVYTE